MFRSMSLAVLMSLGAALPASAASLTPQEEAAFRQHCTADYMRHCSQYQPGSPGLEQCFAAKAKAKELTANCQGAIASYTKANRSGAR